MVSRVSTASTPGSAAALLASMRRIRPCGSGLRNTFAIGHARQPQIAGVDCLPGNLFVTVDALNVASH